MPFIAHDKHGKRVNVFSLEGNLSPYSCPECGTGVAIRKRRGYLTHFMHIGKGDCHYSRESVEHLYAKYFILSNYAKDVGAERAEYEYPIGGRKRIVDVAIFFSGPDRKESHEVQISSIQLCELEQRCDDQVNAGFTPVWWFGEKVLTQPILEFLLGRQYPVITWSWDLLSESAKRWCNELLQD